MQGVWFWSCHARDMVPEQAHEGCGSGAGMQGYVVLDQARDWVRVAGGEGWARWEGCA